MNYISDLLPTILVAATGIITWFLKDKSEKLKYQREKLLEEKTKNYEKILEPIIRTLTGATNPAELDKAIKQIKSFEYRKTAFQFMISGSDKVIKAYNEFFQYLYSTSNNIDSHKLLQLLGAILIEIRKDNGNEKTTLKERDMLRFMINDIDQNNENKI